MVVQSASCTYRAFHVELMLELVRNRTTVYLPDCLEHGVCFVANKGGSILSAVHAAAPKPKPKKINITLILSSYIQQLESYNIVRKFPVWHCETHLFLVWPWKLQTYSLFNTASEFHSLISRLTPLTDTQNDQSAPNVRKCTYVMYDAISCMQIHFLGLVSTINLGILVKIPNILCLLVHVI